MISRVATRQFIERAAAFDGDSCLLWPFSNTYRSGYGRYRHRPAHREVCRRAHGEPLENRDAAHSCGNKLCCNPKHLRWATRRENLADRVIHGTVPQGDSHGMTKYSDATIRELVVRYWAFVEQAAAELKIEKGHAHRILRGGSRKTGD